MMRAAEPAIRADPTASIDAIFRHWFKETEDLMTVVDCDGRFTHVNPAAACFFGHPAEQCIGRSAFDFVHSADRDRTQAAFGRWLADGSTGVFKFENRQSGRAGLVRDMLWTIHALRGRDGRTNGFASCARDITVAKRLEHELSESEARFRMILSSVLDPLITIDAFGTIQAVSQSVERVFGYRPEALVGKNINVLMPEPHHSQHDGYLAAYRRTGKAGIIGVTREFEVLRKDGSRIICDLSVSRADPGGGREPVFTGTFRDVTARKRAEAAVAESERRFHAIFEQAFQYLGLLTPEGIVLEANQTALDAVGVTRDEVVGKPFWDTRWWSFSKLAQERLERAVRTAAQGEFVRFETDVRAAGDVLMEVDFSLKPVRDETGRVVLLISEGRNITDLKRTQRAETNMLRALATIGESAALLAHEIKNPITAVNVALRAVADELGEDHRAILEDLVARMQRLQALMQRTLSFAKPLALRRVVCDAQKFFDDTLDHLRTQIEQAGAQVETRVAHGGVRLTCDPQLMEEVLANLITNAIEAKGQDAHILLSAAHDGPAGAVIAVEDDGPGIPEQQRATLFKPFVTTKRRGTGLGLSICRKIVEEHGGSIGIEDGQLAGARFVLRLPSSV